MFASVDADEKVGCRSVLNELCVQHFGPPRRYLILTNMGLHIVDKLRPVDVLMRLLSESAGQDTEALRLFFDRYSRDQAAAMCLILACGRVPVLFVLGLLSTLDFRCLFMFN